MTQAKGKDKKNLSHPATDEMLKTLLQVVDEMHNLVVIADEEQKILRLNQGGTTKTGYALRELEGKPLTSILFGAGADKQKVKEFSLALQQNKKYKATLLLNTKKGTAFWSEVNVSPVKNPKGKIDKYILIATDATERVERNEELLYNELRWKFAIEKAGDDYFEYNFESNRFFGSENLQSLLHLNNNDSQLDITSLINIIHPDDTEKAVNALFDLLAGSDNTFQQEIRLLNKSGNFNWVNVRAAITQRNAKGNAQHLIGTTSDISKIKETEQELIKAKAKAEEISEYRSRFLATMSHEIRTPLNGIIGLSNLMLLENKNSAVTENLTTLSFSANHLLSLVNDVLDFSKIEAGKIDFAADVFNLHQTVQNVFKIFLSIAKEKNIELLLNISKGIPELVIGDKHRLTQMLNNLVGNAIKFTHKGKVEIALTTENKMGKRATLVFSITDTGIGINKTNQQKIFEDFVQADSGTTAKYGGTGLGLAITKKLIELQGGKLQLQSKPNAGSKFSFALAFNLPDKQSKVAKESHKEVGNATLENINVLLAEDNPVNQKVAVSYLKHWRAKTNCANNGREAVALFKQNSYQLLLVDLFMPEMDGFETIAQIRKLKNGKRVPIIALTASAEQTTMKRAVACGANICLTKPFDAAQLLNEIQKLVSIAPVKIIAEKKHKGNKQFKYIDLKRLEEASLGSKSFVAEMIEVVSQEVPPTLEECNTCLKKKDLPGLASNIHKLKNSLLLIGLDVLKPELQLLEEKARAGKSDKRFAPALAHIVNVWNKAKAELLLVK
jgi:PAS domain S-box-containing protein